SVKGILLGVFFIVGLTYSVIAVNDASGGYLLQRFENIETDRGSGRLEIYSQVINNFAQSPPELKLIGHSHNMVRPSTSLSLSAHNDYLETLYNHGVVGFILLLSFAWILLKRTYRLYTQKSKYFISYMTAFVVFLFMTMISHIILYPTYIVFLVSYLGYVDYEVSNETK